MKQKKNQQEEDKQQKYIISQPEPEIYLFAVGSRAGYPVFLFCCSRSFSVLFMCLSVFVYVLALSI